MATTGDINNAPAGGFKDGGWYWDPSVKQARQYWKGQFGPAGDAGANWWEKTSSSGGSSSSSSSSSSSQSSSSGNPLEDINKAIQDSFKKLSDEVRTRFGEYQAGKPFSVDEVLAQKKNQAAEQIDPYYDQILGDYMTGVERKIQRGQDDTKDLLTELSASTDSFTKQNAMALSDATDKAQQGFAESGLFGAGDQLSAEGRIKESSNTAMDDYTRRADTARKQAVTGLTRNLEDINLQRKGQVGEIERNRFTDIGTRANQLTKEAGQQYVQGFQATLPTELQSASGFDMLKSLGIYS